MEEYILKTIKCIECKCILESPIVLPCGNSVCSKHIPSISDEKSFECLLCNQSHEIPANGFAPNNAINDLLVKYLGEYKLAFTSCDLLKVSLEKLEALVEHPESFISTKIGELKSQVRLKRDELVQEVEYKSEQILIELDSYERECTSSLDRLESSRKKIGTFLEKKKSTLEKSMDDVKSFEASKYKSILEKSDLDAKEVASKIEQFERFTLMNSFEEHKQVQVVFCKLRLQVQEFNDERFDKSNSDQPNSDKSNSDKSNSDRLSCEVKTEPSSMSDETGESGNENKTMDYNEESYEEAFEDGTETETTISKALTTTNASLYFELESTHNGIELDRLDEDDDVDDEEADEEYESDLNGTTQQPQSDSISGNLNDNGSEIRLTQAELDQIYNSGPQSFRYFASRLLKKYFSESELLEENFSLFGNKQKQKPFDPVRIGLIKRHLIDRNGSQPLDDRSWKKCKKQMLNTVYDLRKRKSQSQKTPQIFNKPVNKINKKKSTCLSKEEVEKIYKSGDKSLQNFAARLFRQYFSADERDVSFSRLDPVRMGFIKQHLVERNGEKLSDQKWTSCKKCMGSILARHRIKKSSQKQVTQAIL